MVDVSVCSPDDSVMQMRCVLALLVATALGCTGSGDDPPASTPDAGTAMMGGAACTGAIFDPCTTNDQCSTNNCHFYDQSNFTVCTQTCTPGDNTTCPMDASGNHATCNNKGLCKPAAANSCTR